jgi:hypothetical protein
VETERTGKWYVVSSENNEVMSTRGKSKDEATGALCEQLNMLKGTNNDWSFWHKRGYKVRKE